MSSILLYETKLNNIKSGSITVHGRVSNTFFLEIKESLISFVQGKEKLSLWFEDTIYESKELKEGLLSCLFSSGNIEKVYFDKVSWYLEQWYAVFEWCARLNSITRLQFNDGGVPLDVLAQFLPRMHIVQLELFRCRVEISHFPILFRNLCYSLRVLGLNWCGIPTHELMRGALLLSEANKRNLSVLSVVGNQLNPDFVDVWLETCICIKEIVLPGEFTRDSVVNKLLSPEAFFHSSLERMLFSIHEEYYPNSARDRIAIFLSSEKRKNAKRMMAFLSRDIPHVVKSSAIRRLFKDVDRLVWKFLCS